jgi:hypothetical protein
MVGNRGAANGDEWDAFSRRSRRLINWRAGEVKRIKRGYSKRMRKGARLELRKGGDR